MKAWIILELQNHLEHQMAAMESVDLEKVLELELAKTELETLKED